jgi:ribosomal protein S18 acetylase RimI-like enzyme
MPAPRPLIRRIRSVAGIARILVDFERAFPRSVGSRVGDLQAHAQKLRARGRVYAVMKGRRCLGFVAFYANDSVSAEGYVAHVAVEQASRGTGVGRWLMSRCMAACRRSGMRRVKLEVDSTNGAALSFYQSLGFRVDGQASPVSSFMSVAL